MESNFRMLFIDVIWFKSLREDLSFHKKKDNDKIYGCYRFFIWTLQVTSFFSINRNRQEW